MKRLTILSILAVLLIPGSALALTYNFDGIAAGRYDETAFNTELAPGNIYANRYVTFTGGTFVAQFYASDVGAIAPSISGTAIITYYTGIGDSGVTRATFVNPTNSVSISFGDLGRDGDSPYIYAYDSLGNLIATSDPSITIPSNVAMSITLSVTSATPNIAYVLFGSTSTDPLYPNSIYWDNFTFNENAGNGGAAVPEPATMLLLGAGLLGLVGFSRRKSRS